jgi:tetratricopeptide (TPR) repeat protein/tRNA A-37 threonylcarbamoyl transferase component Bud32
MPSSGRDPWEESLHKDLFQHERERETLGFPKDPPARIDDDRRPKDALLSDLPRIPRYEVLERLGEGATAVVYRARDRELGRLVALKVLRPKMALSEESRQRFRREAKAAAGLSHPHVVSIHDAGEESGQFYLVMELVDGRPMSDLPQGDPADLNARVGLLHRTALGVAAAHDQGIVHRDLKPSNILVTAAGEPKVSDFGLARLVDSKVELTRTGSSLGTPLYMSPEQVEGRSKDISPRTDVYSLGAILYEILTGRPPHVGETLMEIYGRIVRQDPLPPKKLNARVSDDLQTVALKALDKDPQRRYASARAFADDLRRYLSGEPVEARPAGLAYRVYRRLRRRSVGVGLAIGAAAALLSAGSIWLVRRAGRDEKLSILREHARTSLDAALKLRRAGANASMKEFASGLQTAYRQALESAPDLAEVEYLMGRMHRALMEDDTALAFQERALRKDPRYAPALYEHAVLLAYRYGSGLAKAFAEAGRLPPGPVSAQAARELPLPLPQEVEGDRSELVAARESILRDCTALEEILSLRGTEGDARPIREAHVLTIKGMLAFYRREKEKASGFLEEAIRKDPTLEEAWAACCAIARQAFSRDAGDATPDEVERRYRRAEELYARAIANDQGYVPHRLGRADARFHWALALRLRGGNPLPPLIDAEDDLTRVLALTPDFPDAWEVRGNVRALQSAFLMDRREDPVRALDGGEADVREALSRWPDRASLWVQLGNLHAQRARHLQRSAKDPFAAYAAAEEALGRGLQLDRSKAAAWQFLGTIKMQRGDFRQSRGIDPLPDYAGAVHDLNEAIRASRSHASLWSGLAEILRLRAAYRLGRGETPLDDVAAADEAYSEAFRLGPATPTLRAGRGRLRLGLGRLRERAGETPEALRAYADALSDLEAAGLDPGEPDLLETRKRLAELRSGK